MEHLYRAGGLLAAILAVTAIAIFLPKWVSPPAVLEDYGFYRGGDNSEEWSDWSGQYADISTCNDCHEDKYSIWVESQHGTVICETCHGPGRDHLDKGASLTIDASREFCGLCHNRVLGRPNGFPQVDLGQHGGQSACITCHDPHDAGSRVAELHPIPHGLEGRSDCTSCHETGGMMPFPEDHTGLDTDTCLNCHRSE